MTRHLIVPVLFASLLAVLPSASVVAQPVPELLVAPRAASAAPRRDVPARRMRKARVNPAALEAHALRLALFDDVQVTFARRSFSRPGADKAVWVGDGENGAQAVLTAVRGVVTGTVFADNRTFEITIDPDGQYTVTELDPGAFPTDDPMFDDFQFDVLEAPDGFVGDQAVAAATTEAALTGTPVGIDVMIVWTPAAETAAGGRAAMESLALNSVANTNLVYRNSGIGAQLTLVYAAPVNWVETPTSISTDLNAIRSSGDGKLEEVHALRTQYGADVVSLIGQGYAKSGACGIGSLMTTVSTSFASAAFNVVDRTCAVGNLSYAHEVGHNQGLHHDPANATSTPSYPYAYGYQHPSGLFRTVMSYGGATRIAYMSNPTVSYSGAPTGTSSQDNARALNANAATVAAFKSLGGDGGPVTPTCTYTVSTTSLSFSSSGGSKSVSLATPVGCAWTASSGAAWAALNKASGTGNGSVTVTTPSNTGAARSTVVIIAGTQIAVSQAAPKAGRTKR